MKVFIADDSERLRRSLANALMDIPMLRLVGQTGEKSMVLRLVEQTRPELIVLDLRMSGGNTFGLIRSLKAAMPNAVLVIFTNFSYHLYRDRCLEMGADHFFEKTMQSEKMIHLIVKLCATDDSGRQPLLRSIGQTVLSYRNGGRHDI